MRFEIRCTDKKFRYRWQTSGDRGAVLCAEDHRRAEPKHDVEVIRLKAGA